MYYFRCLALLAMAVVFTACPRPKNKPGSKPNPSPTGDEQVFNTADPASVYDSLVDLRRKTLKKLGYQAGRAGEAVYEIDHYSLIYENDQINNITQDSIEMVRAYGNRFEEVKRCGCGDVQILLWKVDSIGGNERGKNGKNNVTSTIGKEDSGVAPNYFVLPELPNQANLARAFAALPKGYSPSVKHPADKDPVTVAILDSGIDIALEGHPSATQAPIYFWQNPAEPVVDGKAGKGDAFCFTDDVIGWDFVNEDNNPTDDNSHGTHVAGIVAHQLHQNAPNVPYEFMSVKILDENGVGTNFDAMCGILYAASNGADVINASWGFYGGPDDHLRRAIRWAHNRQVAISTSAGNDRVDIAQTLHFPAEYGTADSLFIPNVAFVGGLGNGTQLWKGTNIRTEGFGQDGFVAAPAQNIRSLIPLHLSTAGLSDRKSGTSMAAPRLTALLASYRYFRPQDRVRVMKHTTRVLCF
ncbi:MAG: S8 family serine peptidase, partial [Bacteroidota bacterium]